MTIYFKTSGAIIDKPMFEIIIDKIVEKSNCDYGAALLYLDMLSVDPTILNRELFSQERIEIKRFIIDEKYWLERWIGNKHFPVYYDENNKKLTEKDLDNIYLKITLATSSSNFFLFLT